MYEAIAETYVQRTERSAFNALYEQPAVTALLGELAGARVLDLGCAGGTYAALAVRAGARQVVALDASPRMVELARARLGPAVEVRQADLSEPLDVPAAGFDVIVASLVLHYLAAWDAVLGGAARALADGGALVISVGHPMEDAHEHRPADYFATELVWEDWPSFGVRMPVYRRPLSAMFAAFAAAGLTADAVVEPRPTPAVREVNPGLYDRLLARPAFLVFRLRHARDFVRDSVRDSARDFVRAR
ncbi:MAG TPA: class I SAM-dependent methyltransferase [Kofleriaceae bacterium]|nr:class I SAM-dependent methyltransferase [Kofleriaceae bacterium]